MPAGSPDDPVPEICETRDVPRSRPDGTDRIAIHLDDPRPRVLDSRRKSVAAIEVLDLGDIRVERTFAEEIAV
jgi:hypothetical protein